MVRFFWDVGVMGFGRFSFVFIFFCFYFFYVSFLCSDILHTVMFMFSDFF